MRPYNLNFGRNIPIRHIRNIVDVQRIDNRVFAFRIECIKVTCLTLIFEKNCKCILRRTAFKQDRVPDFDRFFDSYHSVQSASAFRLIALNISILINPLNGWMNVQYNPKLRRLSLSRHLMRVSVVSCVLVPSLASEKFHVALA